jgi:hypothetical protein
MSYNPASVSTGEQFSAKHGGTGASSKHPQSGWDSKPSELKHQPGRSTGPDNTVDILPKGTHLPPDRTFLPHNPEYNAQAATGVEHGQGLTNDEIQDTFAKSRSKDVYSGMGMPGDLSQQEGRAMGDKTDYAGNSREEE